MKLKKVAAVIMSAVLCTGLAACGSKEKSASTMWEALDYTAKQEYNQASISLEAATNENLLDELDLDASVFGVDEVKGFKLTLDCTSDKKKNGSVVINGAINKDEKAAKLAELRVVDNTYYVDLTPASEVLMKSENQNLKMVGALLPTNKWITISMDDLKGLADSTGMNVQEDLDQKDAMKVKDQEKLTEALSDTLIPLLKEACGDEFVKKDGSRFTLTLNQDAVKKIVENIIKMEKEGKTVSKAVDSIGDALKNYGNDSIADAYDTIKVQIKDGLADMDEDDLEMPESDQNAEFKISVENKKDSSLLSFGVNADGTELKYEFTLSSGDGKEIKAPESTISLQDFIQGLQGQ